MKTLTILAAQAATADATTGQIDLNDLVCYSMQVNFTAGAGDLVGVLQLQGSLDNVNYANIPNTSVNVVTSTNQIYDIQRCGYRYARIKWTFTSGTGNIAAIAYLKQPIVQYA